eukprot:3182303-Pleurochrysis_carterae.AAC.2
MLVCARVDAHAHLHGSKHLRRPIGVCMAARASERAFTPAPDPFTPARVHPCACAPLRACNRARMHPSARAPVRACTHVRVHPCARARVRACSSARVHLSA